MKYVMFFILLGLVACASRPKNGFVLRGTIPGVKDSTRFELFPDHGTIRKGYIVGGKFEVRGRVERPTLTMLRIRARDGRRWLAEFFMENGNLRFETPHVDSLPRMYQDEDIRKEANYTLTGSSSQESWARYQRASIPLRSAIKKLSEENKKTADLGVFRELQAKQAELAELTRNFIQSQQNVDVNLEVADVFDKEAFTFDATYVDDILALFAPYQDTCESLSKFRTKWEKMRAYTKGKHFENVKLLTPDGEERQLLDQLNKEGYTLIDLWASWCGACRVSIPVVKKLHERFGGEVKFISIAVSDREEAWLKAVEEESMPWAQFRDSGELVKVLGKSYDTKTIPTFFLIDAQGRIVFKGSAQGVGVELEDLFK